MSGISDLLFFSIPADWEVLSSIRCEWAPKAGFIRDMVSFATEFGLTGNLWRQWLTFVLISQENPLTMACERKKAFENTTLMKMAETDMEIFIKLFAADLSEEGKKWLLPMTDYQAPYEGYEMNEAGKRIAALSEKLAQAKDVKAFTAPLLEYYSIYGTGIFSLYKAFRVSENGSELSLVPVTDEMDVTFDDLVGLEEQKKILKENTEAFLHGQLANNVLLYGDSGTGKSTSIHALMHDYFDEGLRLVELSKQDRRLLPQVLSMIKKRNYRFIIFLDDLSFEENESDYKELKGMLEGALEKRTDRVLICATSNRRHLIRETWTDRNDMEYENDIHRSDTMEEKLSLASRFGVTIYFSKPDADEYLYIVKELSNRSGIDMDEKELNDTARKWELRHGGMSGRTASQLITWLKGKAENKS